MTTRSPRDGAYASGWGILAGGTSLKERIVREVGYGLSLEGASSADLAKSKHP